MSYLFVIFLLGGLILIHELGHFAAARASGIDITRFSIGFGPKVWGFRRGATEYWLSAVPLGGYVLPAVEDEAKWFRTPLTARLIFSLGGPAANWLLAIGLLMLIHILQGDVSAHGLLLAPVTETMAISASVLAILPQLFAHPGQLSSVVGIVSSGGDYVGLDLIRAIRFSALLSINLAVFNMLPLPVLDGGKIVLYLLERVYPKAVRVYMPLVMVAAVFLLGLILYATVLDIGRIVA